jgi:halimadienyl-diphosphate synthase
VPTPDNRRRSQFPTALQWLVEHQHADGSWGGPVRYEHDRILTNLAALAPLATFGRRAVDRDSVEDGTRYLWQHGHRLAHEHAELVGFELLLPALVQRAQQAGIAVPPHLDIYARQREEKLRLIPHAALYSPRVTIVHSLEFLGDQAELSGLQAAQGANGSLGNSPATTAFYLARSNDERALDYLQGASTAPAARWPRCCTPARLLNCSGRPITCCSRACPPATSSRWRRSISCASLGRGGVSLSPSFPIPDADDTAVALLFLHELGEPVDLLIPHPFLREEVGFFASFPYERHSSIGVNIHVLHTLLRVPGYSNVERTIDRLLDYIADTQIDGLYWVDKWHISPYYATAHTLVVLRELPDHQAVRVAPLADRSREWVRQTQNADGSWGFYGQPTAEETAYAIMALSCGDTERDAGREADRWRCARAADYLRAAMYPEPGDERAVFPPLWIDKCLYTPSLVVRAVIESALIAAAR